MDTSFCGFDHMSLPPGRTSPKSRSYREEFELLFESTCNVGTNLRGFALDQMLPALGSRFRSVCWRIFLDTLPENKSQWIQSISDKRQEYSDRVTILMQDPRACPSTESDNPLSQADQSQWNRYFLDEELRSMIQQDVVRTWPEIDLFQSRDIQALMVSILFCYARSKPKISYRQGMHEVLAPLIYVIHCDQKAFLDALETGEMDKFDSSTREMLAQLMNPDYTGHDAYTMFCSLMETLESWYICPESVASEASAESKIQYELSQQPFSKLPLEPHTVLGLKLCKINQHTLKRLDPTLQQHLEELEISTQVYGIRWLRLLFGREYILSNVLLLWDVVFADSLSLDLADYIFVAMLIAIKPRLLSSDYSGCLSLLMRYPNDIAISYVIKLALHFRDRYKYPKPVLKNSPKNEASKRANRPQTLDFYSPGGNGYDWQNMLSSGPCAIERELLQSECSRKLESLEQKVAECAHSMDIHLAKLQACLVNEKVSRDDEALVALANLKAIRDQLKELVGIEDAEAADEDWTLLQTTTESHSLSDPVDTLKKKLLDGLMRASQ